MENEIVPFDIAIKLKTEVEDFCVPCNHYYIDGELYTHESYGDFNLSASRCSAPTISQVLHWLRIKHRIFLSINISYCYETDKVPFYMNPNMKPIFNGYFYGIWKLDDLNDDEGHSEYFTTYENAAIAGIRKIIKKISKQI